MELLELLFGVLGILWEALLVVVDYTGNNNARGKGKIPSERYVTR
jgi:hypothetical protein